MENILVHGDFRNFNTNKKYVVKIEDPLTRVTYLRKEVTIPMSGVYKLVLRKDRNIPPENSNSLSEIEGLTPSTAQARPRSPSLSGNNLGLPNGKVRSRSPSLSGNNLGLPNSVGRPRSPSLSGNNLGLPNIVGRPRSPSLSGNNLGLPAGGGKRKTRRHKKNK